MRISDWSSDVCSSDLGVATLATIGNLTAAITGEIASKGRLLLGGDVEVALSQREASGEEKAAFRRFGQLSETIRLRAMAQRPGSGDGPSAVLTELKGVDAAYRSEEHTSELQSLMRISYAVFCLKKKIKHISNTHID